MDRSLEEIVQKWDANGYVMSCYLSMTDLTWDLRNDFKTLVEHYKATNGIGDVVIPEEVNLPAVSSGIKKAYTNDEIFDILDEHFDHFVCTGVLSDIDEDGEFSSNNTYYSRGGNSAACWGLAMQAARTIQNQIDDTPWDSEK